MMMFVRWAVVAAYVALIYVTTFVISVTGVFEMKGVASHVFLAVYVVAATALLAMGLKRFGLRNDYAWLYVAILALLLLIAALNLAEPKDRLHFLEYGLLFVLVLRALKAKTTGFYAYALAIILTAAAGVVDETLQSLYPKGVFDLSDLLNNVFAAYLAAGAALVWERC